MQGLGISLVFQKSQHIIVFSFSHLSASLVKEPFLGLSFFILFILFISLFLPRFSIARNFGDVSNAAQSGGFGRHSGDILALNWRNATICKCRLCITITVVGSCRELITVLQRNVPWIRRIRAALRNGIASMYYLNHGTTVVERLYRKVSKIFNLALLGSKLTAVVSRSAFRAPYSWKRNLRGIVAQTYQRPEQCVA